MSATPFRILHTRLALDLQRHQVEGPINALDPVELETLDDLIEGWGKIDERAAKLKADGVEYDAEEHRALLRAKFSTLLGGIGGVLAGQTVLATAEPPPCADAFFWSRHDGQRPWFGQGSTGG